MGWNHQLENEVYKKRLLTALVVPSSISTSCLCGCLTLQRCHSNFSPKVYFWWSGIEQWKKTGCLWYVRHEILKSRVGLLSWLNLHHFKLLGLISSQLQAGDLSLSTEEMRLRLLLFLLLPKNPLQALLLTSRTVPSLTFAVYSKKYEYYYTYKYVYICIYM